MTRDEVRKVYEHFKAGKKEEVGKELIRRGIEVEVRAVKLCDDGGWACFLAFHAAPDCDDTVLRVLWKNFGEFFSVEKPMECFCLSTPSGVTSTAHYKLQAGAFAAVAAVMNKVAEIAHPEIFRKLTA